MLLLAGIYFTTCSVKSKLYSYQLLQNDWCIQTIDWYHTFLMYDTIKAKPCAQLFEIRCQLPPELVEAVKSLSHTTH